MLELESEGDQLERSFHSYLQRHQERNKLLNKDAKKIWQNYEIGKKLLSTNTATNIKINSLNIVPAAVPVAEVKTNFSESTPDKIDFDQQFDDGFSQNFENPYRIYDFALRSREYPTSLQQVTQLIHSDIHNASSLPKELEAISKQNRESKDYSFATKMDTQSFHPIIIEELNTTLHLEQSAQLATDQFTKAPADQIDKSTVSQITPNKDKDITLSESNVLSIISPVFDITSVNVIPISSKPNDTPIEILSEFKSQLTNEQDAVNHMEIQNLSKSLISSYKNTENDVIIPIQSENFANIKLPDQNNPTEINSAESDVQISVANKSSSSEDFWN